jgi:outer membrane protein assembly factor BamB
LSHGVRHLGRLRGVRPDTGATAWQTSEPVSGKRAVLSGAAFLVKNGEQCFPFNGKGVLVVAKLTPKGYTEVDRRKLLVPTNVASGREVVWSHPAFANKRIFARNDKGIRCASLAAV